MGKGIGVRRMVAVLLVGLSLLAGLALLPQFQSSSGWTGVAWADSLQDRRHQRDQERKLQDEAAFTSEICGTKITTSIHWDSFNTRGDRVFVVGPCDVALSAIERLCRENPGKVRGRISHMQCGAGDKRAVAFQAPMVSYAVPPRPRGDDVEFVYRYLKRRL